MKYVHQIFSLIFIDFLPKDWHFHFEIFLCERQNVCLKLIQNQKCMFFATIGVDQKFVEDSYITKMRALYKDVSHSTGFLLIFILTVSTDVVIYLISIDRFPILYCFLFSRFKKYPTNSSFICNTSKLTCDHTEE